MHSHRDPTSHICQAYSISSPEPVSRNAKARELLAKNFPASAPPSSTQKKPVIKKQNQVLERMKLRQKAKSGEPGLGLESVAPKERLYVQARAEGDYEVLWFRKVTV